MLVVEFPVFVRRCRGVTPVTLRNPRRKMKGEEVGIFVFGVAMLPLRRWCQWVADIQHIYLDKGEACTAPAGNEQYPITTGISVPVPQGR